MSLFFGRLKNYIKFPTRITYSLKANYDDRIVKVLINKLKSIEISSPFELCILKKILKQIDNPTNLTIVAGVHGLHHNELYVYLRNLRQISEALNNEELILSAYDIESLLKVKKYLNRNKAEFPLLIRLIPYGVLHSKIGIALKELIKTINETKTKMIVDGVHEHSISLYNPNMNREIIYGKFKYIKSSIDILIRNGIMKEHAYINIGGGMVPPLLMNDSDLFVFGKLVNSTFEDLDVSYIIIELGRGLVGDVVAIRSRVVSTYRKYAILDVSTNVLVPFPSAFYIMVQERCIDVDTNSWEVYWNSYDKSSHFILSGRLCSINDIIPGVVVLCKNIRRNDFFIVLNAGAYALNMQSNFVHVNIEVIPI